MNRHATVATYERMPDKRSERKADNVLRKDDERLKRLEILSAFGTVDFDPTYDYKAERRKKRNG